MKLIIRNSNGEITEQDITADMRFTPTAGEQYFFTGVENYTFNLTENNSTLDVHFLDNNGERINVVLHDMAELIQQNNPMDSFSMESTFGVSTNQAGDQAIDEALNNKELQSGEIVEALKDALSMDGSTLAGGAVIDDFQGLLDALDATATGETQNTAYNPLFDAVQTQEVDPVEASASARPDNYGDNDNSIERAEGFELEEFELVEQTNISEEIEEPQEADTVEQTPIPEVVAEPQEAEIEIEKTREIETKTEVETPMKEIEVTETVMQTQIEEFTDTREVTETFTNTRTETQEFENTREIEVEVNPIMKEVTTEEPVSTNITFVVDVSSSMSNVDLDLAEAGIAKIISQYEELGDVNINIVQFYGNGNESTGWNSSDALTIEDTLYRDKGGTDPEQGMRRAEQDFADAPQADQNIYIQMQDGNAYGSYEDDFEDYLSDFGDFINEQMDAFYTVGVNVNSLRDFNDINEVVDNPNDSIFARDASDLDEVVDGIAKVEVSEIVDVEAMEAAGYELRDGTWYETTTETFTDTREVEVEFEDTRVIEEEFTNTREIEVPVEVTTTEMVLDTDAIEERGLVEEDGTYYEIGAETESYTETATIEVDEEGEFTFIDDVDTVDFDALPAEINGVSTINISDEASQTLTLDADDIVNMNDDHEMVIVGNDGDVIELEGEGWSRETGVAVDGEEGTFDHYTSTSTDGTVVDVYVESEITVQTDDFF